MKNGFCFFCLYILFLLPAGLAAQERAAVGIRVDGLPVEAVLNHEQPVKRFADLQKSITIIDFFGTWCIPCLRALPHLSSLQGKFSEQLAVVLVSNEDRQVLQKFIQARRNVSFPVIVDSRNKWNEAFQPPALPFTVIANREGVVIAVKEAAAITEQDVRGWLQLGSVATTTPAPPPATTTTLPAMVKSDNPSVRLSQELLYAVRTGESIDRLTEQLAALDPDALASALRTDAQKKAFWINLYNGYTQAALQQNAGQYQQRSAFFGAKRVPVAGMLLSLDDIEHGILRRSRLKWSLGYLGNPFPPRWQRKFRVDSIDYRIHFALNCGARSCPPIAFYSDGILESQLELATKAYLTGEVEYNASENTVAVPRLMSWFRADFGGKKGVLNLLQQKGLLPPGARPRIEYKEYDWSLSLSNYTSLNP
jgi:thiol-disulfide isomerase/thioredoxin